MIKVIELTNEYLPSLLKMIEDNEGKQSLDALENSIRNKTEQEEYLVCVDNDTNSVIGYSKTTAFTHGILKLDYIYIAPSLRRDTNGSIVLVAVYNRAINRLTAGIIAECNEDNEVGCAFLKARGFVLNKQEDGINFYAKSLMHMYIPHKHD